MEVKVASPYPFGHTLGEEIIFILNQLPVSTVRQGVPGYQGYRPPSAGKKCHGNSNREKIRFPDIQGLSETYANRRKNGPHRVNPLWLTGPSPTGVINMLIAPDRLRVNEMQRSASDMSFRGTDKNSDNLQPLKFEYLPKYQPPIPPASPTAGFFCLQGCRYIPERRDAREGCAYREGRSRLPALPRHSYIPVHRSCRAFRPPPTRALQRKPVPLIHNTASTTKYQ